MGHEVTRQNREDKETGATRARECGERAVSAQGEVMGRRDGRGRRWEENPGLAGRIREPQRSKSSGRDWSN